MRSILRTLLAAVMLTVCHQVALPQAPDAFNYQAVARNANGDPLALQAVSVLFQLRQGTATGPVVFAETHGTTTNAQGLINLQVGTGTAQVGSLGGINWAQGPYFMEVGLDITGGGNHVSMGTQQLLSVPYAMFAQRTPCFSTSLLGDTLFTGNGCFVIIPGVSAANGGCLDIDADGFYDRPGCGPVDCNDTLASVFPGGVELCGDGIDNDCNGQVDELTDPQAFTPWFADADGDGFGDNGVFVMACAQPVGHVANNDDCDDADPQVYPGNGCVVNCSETETQFIAGQQLSYMQTLYQAALTCFLQDGGLTEQCFYNQLSLVPQVGVQCHACGYELMQCLAAECPSLCGNGLDLNCVDCLTSNGCLAQFTACVTLTDLDGDGWATESDCDDSDADLHPLALEDPCDGIDNDCDGQVDEGVPTWYQDLDADGWGDPAVSMQSCTPPPGFIQLSFDCNDSDPALNPGVPELCNGIDDNCDGVIDDGAIDAVEYYLDFDGDGYGTPFSGSVMACALPAGYVAQSGDCNDFDPFINPGMIEYCEQFGQVDNNCDGTDQPCMQLECGFYAGQNWGACGPGFQCINYMCEPCPAAGTPCDDANACTVNDQQDGLCNCVGTPVPNGTACSDADPCTTTETCVSGACQGVNIGQDLDGDGTPDCAGDCNDQNGQVYPGAPELCDNLDNDCDGLVDEDCPVGAPCDGPDADQCVNGVYVCGPAGECLCNESGPGSAEICLDGQDNDCDGQIDEGCGLYDLDQDGFTDDVDCNDQDPSVNPAQPELCGDLQDNDCNGQVDEGCPIDLDGDGFDDQSDCDDQNAAVFPGAAEVCNTVDDDCDGQVDEGGVCGSSEICDNQDNDGDGFIDEDLGLGLPCNCVGFIVCDPMGGTTCNAPPPVEVCDSQDNDCDGQVDEGGVCSTVDNDGDGFAANQECDDFNAAVNPNAPELCDGIDNNCDGQVDEGNPGGGSACSTGLGGGCSVGTLVCQNGTLTCVPNTPPTAEVCDAIDNDCDGLVDEGNPDGGAPCNTGLQGTCSVGTLVCQNGALTCVPNTPPTAEVCDGLDNDCDGQVDEGNPGGGGNCLTGFSGQCAAGTLVCQNGALTCVPVFSPTTEVCDGVDNDCDGQVDEGVGCSVPNGVGGCVNGQCTILVCNTGFANCDGNTSNGCETNLNNSVNNCGQCGQPCMLSNAIPACINGLCTIASCLPGFSDCDGLIGNGCETFGTCP